MYVHCVSNRMYMYLLLAGLVHIYIHVLVKKQLYVLYQNKFTFPYLLA